MSLDVYIKTSVPVNAGSGIFIRENGSTVEVTREQWNERNPGREPCMTISEDRDYWSANITHNLGGMAKLAGLYGFLWRPDEAGINTADQLIAPLVEGLKQLHAEPDKYRALNPPNGWGDYEGLVKFAQDYLLACIANPNGEVSVWR